MNETECGTVREAIPDLVAGRLSQGESDAIETHMTVCEECRAELALVQMLHETRATAPVDLSARIVAAARRRERRGNRPWWGISAAAVAALALGIGITGSDPITTLPADDFAYETEEGALWISDDGLLAGAPSLDALSDEELMELLDELAINGGAA